jgi:FHA domain
MNISSRTPEGDPNRCPVCGNDLRLEPSRSSGDAPCPSCGSLLWFAAPMVPALTTPLPRSSEIEPNGELILPSGRDAITLDGAHLILGRRESCDVCLRYPNISGRHCELVFKDGYWIIRDLHSTNGIKVNGVRVKETVLYPGDTIAIGKRKYTIKYLPPID